MSSLRPDGSLAGVFSDQYPKLVIWSARDGVALTAYSGSVFQPHGRHFVYTDEWLADAIQQKGAGRRLFATLRALKTAADSRNLQMQTIGWKASLKRRRSGMFLVGWLPGQQAYGTYRNGTSMGAIGDPGVTAAGVGELFARAASDHPASSLVDAIRWRAQTARGVGDTVLLASMVPGEIVLRFAPGIGWRPPSNMAQLREVTGYFPMIVDLHETSEPQLAAGEFVMGTGWTIRSIPPPGAEPTIKGLTVFNRRPPPGGRRPRPQNWLQAITFERVGDLPG